MGPNLHFSKQPVQFYIIAKSLAFPDADVKGRFISQAVSLIRWLFKC